jgi:hypothetical protein
VVVFVSRTTFAELLSVVSDTVTPHRASTASTAATLAGWRDDFLAAGQAALKSRPTYDRDGEFARLRAKVGELTMDNELLLQRCRADHPFVPRRRKK